MTHENRHGQNDRVGETRERERKAAAKAQESSRQTLPDVNLDGGGETLITGRNSAQNAAVSRRTEQG
ncbi:hypothetical protein [Lysobacter sp. N42]|uniref:hypothetical protein n=1 Tax=Lysobacter sp. N42 TaxID=2545719 RepID=UPI001049DD5D|nr:hypothetical protein [Lysobacter sp. N42]TCZ78988.1 hypothetical protein EYQ95_25470 [Lysobacter sp. N42]